MRCVITGGPGFGKTALVEALAARGYRTAPESARELIQEIAARGGAELPWLDRPAFEELLIPLRVRDHAAATGVCFFDRGLPDEVAYYRKDGYEPSESCLEAVAACRYDRVFIVPPWPAIHVNDAERLEPYEEAVRIHEAIVRAYRELGYPLTEVPRGTVEARAAFVLASVGLTSRAPSA